MPTQWGIVGASSICQDFIRTLSKLPCDEHKIIGITAIEDLKAKQLVKQFEIPKFYTNVENLSKDNDIDVVFVGCQLTEHFRVVNIMLNHQKHVVCCKPLGMNLKETTAIIAKAKEYHLLLMEAIGPRYLPSYQFLREQLKKKIIGEPIQMIANIGIPIPKMDHSHYKEFGGGTILDLGVYPLQLMLLTLGMSPYEIIALGSLNEQGVDENMGTVIRYGDGKLAIVSTHSKGLLPNEAFIIGTKGMIKLNEPFWNPKSISIGSETHTFHTLEEDFYTSIHRHSIGLKYIANEAAKYLNAGLIESNLITHQESLILANLQDRIRKQIGVFYRSDHDLTKKNCKI